MRFNTTLQGQWNEESARRLHLSRQVLGPRRGEVRSSLFEAELNCIKMVGKQGLKAELASCSAPGCSGSAALLPLSPTPGRDQAASCLHAHPTPRPHHPSHAHSRATPTPGPASRTLVALPLGLSYRCSLQTSPAKTSLPGCLFGKESVGTTSPTHPGGFAKFRKGSLSAR